MGLELPDDDELIRSELQRLKSEYQSSWGNIFFQLGIVNEIIRFENCGKRTETFVQDMRTMRLNIREQMKQKYHLVEAFRENMPQSTIIFDISKSNEELLNEMNSWTAQRVKKAIKKGVKVGFASPDQYDLFFEKWRETAGGKWFSTVTKQQFDDLLRYLRIHNAGNAFISELDGEIIAGSICLYNNDTIVYLYGFTNRKFTNIWGHHYLKYAMFERARDYGFKYADLMWGAPTGFPDHPLNGVSKFKESLGGTKIEQYGNFDIPLNPLLYKLLGLRKK